MEERPGRRSSYTAGRDFLHAAQAKTVPGGNGRPLGLSTFCSGGLNRRAQADLAVGEDVGAQAALVDQRPQEAGSAEPVEVDAGLAQPQALAHDVADAEGATDQGVDVDP